MVQTLLTWTIIRIFPIKTCSLSDNCNGVNVDGNKKRRVHTEVCTSGQNLNILSYFPPQTHEIHSHAKVPPRPPCPHILRWWLQSECVSLCVCVCVCPGLGFLGGRLLGRTQPAQTVITAHTHTHTHTHTHCDSTTPPSSLIWGWLTSPLLHTHTHTHTHTHERCDVSFPWT